MLIQVMAVMFGTIKVIMKIIGRYFNIFHVLKITKCIIELNLRRISFFFFVRGEEEVVRGARIH